MQSSGGAKKRTTIDAQTGKWALGKTIGQGSMGKVKLAKNVETGEQVRGRDREASVRMMNLFLSGCCKNCPEAINRRTSKRQG